MIIEARICGICLIRDAVDLAYLLCGHYLRNGFDRLIFLDDGSSDGTYELLSRIGSREAKVSVRRLPIGPFRQAEALTDLANECIAEGYQIVFPFDSDEFWNINAKHIRELAASARSGLFVGRWVQFVQSRQHQCASRWSLLGVKYRAPAIDTRPAEGIERLPQSFVCVASKKVAFKADSLVNVNPGQHSLAEGPTNVLASDLKLFHLPLRSAAEINRRARQADRILTTAKPGHGWQAKFFRDAAAAGTTDEVWAANSVDDNGFIDVGGRRLKLIPDKRLRNAFVRAWLYMLAHHPDLTLFAGLPGIAANSN